MPPQPTFVHPTIDKTPNIQPPEIKIDDSNGHAIHALSSPPHAASDSAAFGVASTHSTPPYPLDARALGHAGTVLLQITISPQGDVVSATVVQSSGFAELDADGGRLGDRRIGSTSRRSRAGAPVTSQTAGCGQVRSETGARLSAGPASATTGRPAAWFGAAGRLFSGKSSLAASRPEGYRGRPAVTGTGA